MSFGEPSTGFTPPKQHLSDPAIACAGCPSTTERREQASMKHPARLMINTHRTPQAHSSTPGTVNSISLSRPPPRAGNTPPASAARNCRAGGNTQPLVAFLVTRPTRGGAKSQSTVRKKFRAGIRRETNHRFRFLSPPRGVGAFAVRPPSAPIDRVTPRWARTLLPHAGRYREDRRRNSTRPVAGLPRTPDYRATASGRCRRSAAPHPLPSFRVLPPTAIRAVTSTRASGRWVLDQENLHHQRLHVPVGPWFEARPAVSAKPKGLLSPS